MKVIQHYKLRGCKGDTDWATDTLICYAVVDRARKMIYPIIGSLLRVVEYLVAFLQAEKICNRKFEITESTGSQKINCKKDRDKCCSQVVMSKHFVNSPFVQKSVSRHVWKWKSTSAGSLILMRWAGRELIWHLGWWWWKCLMRLREYGNK